MANKKTPIVDPVFQSLRDEAEAFAAQTPSLDFFVQKLAREETLGAALSALISAHMGGSVVDAASLEQTMRAAHARRPELAEAAAHDLQAVMQRDPAAEGMLRPFLFFKGFHALQLHRVAHALWEEGQRDLALFLQYRTSVVFGVDIHPAALIGYGIMFDHATGIVIGETAIIEDDVSMLHGVTLGGTGKEKGDRHPKIRHGAMIGADSTILGNIEVGEGAVVAAGSMVLKAVPPHVTVAGVPAQIVGATRSREPSCDMDQRLPEGETFMCQ